jgi:hypothetical protein
VRATVSDEDGGTSAPAFYQSVVVFDAEGAFVTGGGFYDVGLGDAKAHFTITARFLHEGTVPNGRATVWNPSEHIDFESTAIEMLVAAGNRAQFWGTGTLNGSPARFRITAVDGGEGPDAIRIELWNAAGSMLLYDSQPGAAQDAPPTTMTEGGKIHVHGG